MYGERLDHIHEVGTPLILLMFSWSNLTPQVGPRLDHRHEVGLPAAEIMAGPKRMGALRTCCLGGHLPASEIARISTEVCAEGASELVRRGVSD